MATRLNGCAAWLSFAPLRRAGNGWTSDLASARYRLTIPARALAELGFECTVVDVVRLGDPINAVKRIGHANVAIFGKLVGTPHELAVLGPRVLQLAAALASRGVKVVADFSDDVFREPARRAYFHSLANMADAVVASTEGLAAILREQTPSPVYVVTDPVEGPRGAAAVAVAVAPHRPLRLLWYGHPSNLPTLQICLQQLRRLATDLPLAISLITAPGRAADAAAAEVRAVPGASCNVIPWSARAVFDALPACDAVVIPSDPGERHLAIKSHNRFSEGVWGGRCVVAHPLPSYEELSAYGWVGNDLGAGIEWLLGNPDAALARIHAGQAAIEERFMPSAIARRWQEVILQQQR